MQHRRGADADLLGDGEQPVDVDRQSRALRRCSAFSAASMTRDAGLVVEMARDDEAVVEEFRLRIDGDDVADVDAERCRSRAVARQRVDAQLDMVPADRLGVDLVVEGVARRLQRQDRAAIGALLGEDRARARPRRSAPTSVPIGTSSSRPLSLSAFTCAPSVSRCATMARAPRCASRPGRWRGWRRAGSARRRRRAARSSRADAAHDGVGVAGRAGDREQALQRVRRDSRCRSSVGSWRCPSLCCCACAAPHGVGHRQREQQVDEALGGRLRLVVGEARPLVGLDEGVVRLARRAAP